MDILNNKVQSTQDETRFETQNVGLYGYDSTATQWRRLACDSEGKQKIEATLELDSSGLAKEAKQDTIINATLRDINNTGAIGDGSSQATALSLGYDRSNGQGRAILVDSGGKVEVNSTMNAGHGLATEAKQDDIINATNRAINNTGSIGDGSTNATSVALGYDRSGGKGRAVLVNGNGELMVNLGSSTTQNVNCLGNESGDGTGTARHLHLDGSGNVQTNVVNTINIAPSNSSNGHITDDPANSLAVALTGRQTIGTATTQTFLKCNASGELITSSSGGGSANTNLFPTLNSITTATSFGGGIITSDYLDLTNAKNVVINCIHTGNAVARTNFQQDISISLEFTDDSSNTVCYSGASTPVFGIGTIDAAGNSTGSAVAVLSFGENSEALGQITGKFCRVAVVNNDNSGTGTAYAIDFKVVVSGI